ncbi:MAG: DUF104 domain-containing protein, partial [Actinobacteria bacterium]|nr:DUF104 domain-containing protein [Actinomycetota bacterium]
METVFTAIYKNGILKPLSKVDFEENKQVVLKIIHSGSIVKNTKGMIKGKAQFLKQIV